MPVRKVPCHGNYGNCQPCSNLALLWALDRALDVYGGYEWTTRNGQFLSQFVHSQLMDWWEMQFRINIFFDLGLSYPCAFCGGNSKNVSLHVFIYRSLMKLISDRRWSESRNHKIISASLVTTLSYYRARGELSSDRDPPATITKSPCYTYHRMNWMMHCI